MDIFIGRGGRQVVERANENYITANANPLNPIVAQFVGVIDAVAETILAGAPYP